MNLFRLLLLATIAFFVVDCTPYDPGMRDWRGQVEITKEDSSKATDTDSNVSTDSDSSVDVRNPQIIDSSTNNSEAKDSSQSDLDTATDGDDAVCELDHATAKVVGSQCVIDFCDEGYDDCDADPSTGCETGLSDNDHCGACDRPCELENATASCSKESCELEDCDQGFADCNNDSRDGCETSLDTWSHCGTCDNLCSMPETGSVTCEDGECVVIECEPGWDSCTGDANAFCETRIDTMDHCGSCDHQCNDNTSDHCEESECVCGGIGHRCAIWECCWMEVCWPWPCIPDL